MVRKKRVKKRKSSPPRTMKAKAPTGPKGTGPEKKVTFYKESTDIQKMHITDNKIKKGYRIYSRYANRYGRLIERSPKGRVRKIAETWG